MMIEGPDGELVPNDPPPLFTEPTAPPPPLPAFEAVCRCIKCGLEDEHITRYQHGWGAERPERLMRECRRCDYQWTQAIVEVATTEGASA